MKIRLTVLLFIIHLTVFSQKSYILKPDAQKYLIIDNRNGLYKPGDTLFLDGHFKAVAVNNLSGDAKKKILISNVRGKALTIGDSLWSGGSWGHGIAFSNCHYIKVAGSAKGKFNIIGSKVEPARTAYMNMYIGSMSDNFIVHTITIKYGGLGVVAKSEVWREDITLNNFEFFSLDISGTYNEALYIGHTAAYWNIKTNQPAYPGPNDTYQNDATTYRRPIKLKGVKVYKCTIYNIGNDAIQVAAADAVKVYNNTVTNCGMKKEWAHAAGILIGGRCRGVEVYNNYVHDIFGDMVQVFADSGVNVYNNLLVRNQGEGVHIRGGKGLIVNFHNNTVAYTGANGIRINGYYGGTGKNILSKNLLLQPKFTGPVYPKYFIYLENGGSADDRDNKKYATVAEAKVEESMYFLPVAGSPSVGYGYRK